jgi:cytochrome c oxidase subunit 2
MNAHRMRTVAPRIAFFAGVLALTILAPTLPNHVRAQDTPPPAHDAPRIVEITAKRFEFNPKEITLKQGETVTIRLTTLDVTHGFFMKALGIDTVVEPGKPTEVTLTPRATGSFTTICDHFCGEGHGNMHMTIHVE